MYVDWQTIVTAATVIAAVVAFGTYFTKLHNWILQQNKQDIDISGIKKELQITTYPLDADIYDGEEGSSSYLTGESYTFLYYPNVMGIQVSIRNCDSNYQMFFTIS